MVWGFFTKKKTAILHFHNIMSCKSYMSQKWHENYGKSKMMQNCLKDNAIRLSKKMPGLAHTPKMSCKVCILDSPKYQAS